jgi:Tfp pilus assembly protein PilO
MTRSFKLALPAVRGTRFWLQVLCGALALLNAVALFLYLLPPGGTRQELMAERDRLHREIAAVQARAVRLKMVAAKAQTGGKQSADFEAQYFLPRRQAYAAVMGEIQRLAHSSGLRERDAVYSEEPIEGTDDLSLLNSTANYEGSYDNLLHFLQEVNQSPMLLMLDSLQAAPQQQKGGGINTSIRFQAIIRDDGSQKLGDQS